MRNVRVAFDVREDGKVPVGYKEIRCHLVSDIRSDGLARKARFCTSDHLLDRPKGSTTRVLSRDFVHSFFWLTALNDVDVLACDVQNACVNVETKEKVWFRGGLELCPDKGKVVVIVRALYSLESSSVRRREYMARMLRVAGFESCKADPDLWLRPAVEPDGMKIYEYVMCYRDDYSAEGLEPKKCMDHL